MYSLKILLPATLLLLISSQLGYTQTVQRCATDERQALQLQRNPEMRELWERKVMEEITAKVAHPGHKSAGGTPRIIPVVVHIIQTSGVEKISDARVLTQIDVLNEDFRRLNADTIETPADFLGVAADSEIEFRLATIDPSGCPTTGINRIINTELAIHDMDSEEVALKGLIQWDPYNYFNIWVPDRITGGILGYATFPTWLTTNADRDGIVVSGSYFGRGEGTPSSSYNLGRTTTHEVGHWLGLYHTFQGGCEGMSDSTCAIEGDRCCDTPPTSSSNFSCPPVMNSCAETPADLPDQTANYMDYVDDGCMNLFTQDQKDWFFLFLDNERANLWSPSNLAATGCDGSSSSICAPVVQFTSDLRHICAGETVQFTDLSYGPPDTWSWDFPGGIPSTSTMQHPTVTYSTPGIYAVTLNASNSLGSGTATDTTWIVVSSSSNPPLVEGFDATTSIPIQWEVRDEDGQGSWEHTTLAGSASPYSAAIDNYTRNSEGTSDGLVSPPINLKLATSAALTFDMAYKRSSAFRFDSLSVLVSTDCGTTWTTAWEKGSAGLATVTGFQITTPYVPADSTHWRTETVDLSAFLGNEEVKIQFKSDGRNGQWLYLDQVNMAAAVGVEDASTVIQELTVWPNPTHGSIDLEMMLQQPVRLSVSINDLTGRLLLNLGEAAYSAGRNSIRLDLRDFPGGVYAVSILTPSGCVTRRIVKL